MPKNTPNDKNIDTIVEVDVSGAVPDGKPISAARRQEMEEAMRAEAGRWRSIKPGVLVIPQIGSDELAGKITDHKEPSGGADSMAAINAAISRLPKNK